MEEKFLAKKVKIKFRNFSLKLDLGRIIEGLLFIHLLIVLFFFWLKLLINLLIENGPKKPTLS